jgi:Family of unknown function (DUF6328)
VTQPDGQDDRDESSEERLDRNWDELLQELRVVQTGIQLLSGFLLTLPFTQVFASLDDAQQGLYLGLVVLAGVAVGVNLTPIMLHRRVFREHVKGQVAIAAVALLIVGTVVLIFSVVVSWAAGLLAGAALAVVLATLLALLPQRLAPR